LGWSGEKGVEVYTQNTAMGWMDAMIDFTLVVSFHCDDHDMAAFTASYGAGCN